MHIHDILAGEEPKFSFEFFPPKTEASTQDLFASISELQPCAPSFVSVTYGAGGSTRNLTHDLVMRLKQETALDPIPHLTCVGHSQKEIAWILERYTWAGVGNILALRGDAPGGAAGYPHGNDTFPHAADLVRFIRNFSDRYGHRDRRGFGIGVAAFPEGHPATPNRLIEMDHLKAKVDAGADYICTQMFFDNRDFYDFQARCELAGIHLPIIAGLMPVGSLSGLQRMASLAGGCRFPAKLLKALQRAENDPEGVRRIGIHYATQQCSDLLHHGVKGIHFYTLNQSTATREILLNLGVASPFSGALHP